MSLETVVVDGVHVPVSALVSAGVRRKLTRAEAVALVGSEWWADRTPREAVLWQLDQDTLALPWDKFHELTERALGRAVWTHEFVDRDRLILEAEDLRGGPTAEEFARPLDGKRVILVKLPGAPAA